MAGFEFYWWYFTHYPKEFIIGYCGEIFGFIFKALVFILITRFIYKKILRLRQPISSDGHRIKPSENNTIRTPKHPNVKSRYANLQDSLPQYIVHEEPEEGYVILNGKKISKKDLKYK